MFNEAIKVIKSRRSVRKYIDKEIPEEVLREIVIVPGWHQVVTTDRSGASLLLLTRRKEKGSPVWPAMVSLLKMPVPV